MHRINRRAPFHHDHFAGALIGLLTRPGNGGAEAAHAGI